MPSMTVALATKYKEQAENGVDYTRHGAKCPGCGQRAKVKTTRAWDGNVRVRFHRCDNGKCVICSMGVSIKSIEVDDE